MDVKDLKTLVKIITETDITEFEMESSDQKIVIRRGYLTGALPVEQKPAVQPAGPVTVAVAPPPVQDISPAIGAAPVKVAEEGCEKIKSPIVGTFYRAPSPESPPYVEVGDVVEKGQVLCLVEAMKLMNEIEAEYKCRIKEILKENAQPVEFGDILFHVERV